MARQHQDRPIAVFPANSAVSNPVPIGPDGCAGIATWHDPAAWTAANIIVEVSSSRDRRELPASTSWGKLHKEDGTIVYAVTPATAGMVIQPPEAWPAGTFLWIRFRSVNTSNPATDVNQLVERRVEVSLLR